MKTLTLFFFSLIFVGLISSLPLLIIGYIGFVIMAVVVIVKETK